MHPLSWHFLLYQLGGGDILELSQNVVTMASNVLPQNVMLQLSENQLDCSANSFQTILRL